MMVSVTNSALVTDRNIQYFVYTIQVDYWDKLWTLEKRYNMFIYLYDQLSLHFPSMNMPPIPQEFNVTGLDSVDGWASWDHTEQMNRILSYLSNNPIVWESLIFKNFLDIDKNFPDELG